jgi:hypothetical protein
MKLNWDRYYLPTLLSIELIASVGIYIVSQQLYSLVASIKQVDRSQTQTRALKTT